MDRLTIHYQLVKSANKTTVNLSSNIDKMFNDRLNTVVDEKFTQIKQTIKAQVDQQLLEQQRELESVKSKWQIVASAQLQYMQILVDKEKQAVDARKIELEQQIQDELNRRQQDLEQKAWVL